MSWKTIVIGAECKVSLNMNRMKITMGDEYHNIPLTDLDTVIFSHNKTVITIPLITKLMENNVNIVICDQKNDPVGVFQPFNMHSLVFKQLDKQINWKITRKKKLWKKIVEQKINSEIQVLQLLKVKEAPIDTLKQYRNTIYNDDQTNREGASARIYFSALFGKDFIRGDPDAINFAMNYGYKIVASYISKCIVSRGLITQLGIHHKGESNAFNLVYDFIEPFRAIIDAWVAVNITNDFTIVQKQEIIEILQCKIFINNKWFRLNDAIEDMVDAYIGFLNYTSDQLLFFDLSKGILFDDE
ncbi:type II CRISPR-associated endonuclease Cas1 [Absicoccus porci]|uniref:CRISPR-associated endonuclease Cas1 n=1 Tax=Absicoccus porci TaxID=2486576 RepID=A0A3N0I321_9FIRM|nr:type II CRISPR-associated endonuclease Cas1 [Absicoccus porci]RNM31317.1 type II CRISPR-associated endonuclease Cas1 [Absicoccus porci]